MTGAATSCEDEAYEWEPDRTVEWFGSQDIVLLLDRVLALSDLSRVSAFQQTCCLPVTLLPLLHSPSRLQNDQMWSQRPELLCTLGVAKGRALSRHLHSTLRQEKVYPEALGALADLGEVARREPKNETGITPKLQLRGMEVRIWGFHLR